MSNAWSSFPALLSPLRQFGAAVVGNKIFAAGRAYINFSPSINVVDVFDGTSWTRLTTTTPISIGEDDGTAVAYQGASKFVVFGDATWTIIQVYDPVNDSLYFLPNMTTLERDDMVVVSYDF